MHMTPASLETTIRPRLMVVAARHALEDYVRETHLRVVLGLPFGKPLPDALDALHALRSRELELEAARKRHDASWRAADHVAVMAALMAEAREVGHMSSACHSDEMAARSA